MAGMKGFYVGLAGIAVVGTGALLWARNAGTATVPIGPISQAAIDAARGFPGHVEGSEDAPVEIIEYADFQCPACRQMWVVTVQDVKARLVKTGQVRWVFRDFPLDGHANSRSAHHAGACAGEQGLFPQMHDQLFDHQREWSVANPPERLFRGYAEAAGADVAQYDVCMDEGRYRARIQASYEEGLSLGINSTPSLIIGNQIYQYLAYDPVKVLVDSLTALATQ